MGKGAERSDQTPLRALEGNPLLDEFRRSQASEGRADELRDALTSRYAFAICDDEAISLLDEVSPNGIVELGAGTGYWARLLHERGVEIVAFDVAPPPSKHNKWFAGSSTWYPVHRGDETVLSAYSERTLLIVWPTRDETWPADALEICHAAGCTTVAYVGQAPGGKTGDDRFFAMLGAYDRCYACAYGLHDRACICGTPVLWRQVTATSLPSWPEGASELQVFRRAAPPHTVLERKNPKARGRWQRFGRSMVSLGSRP